MESELIMSKGGFPPLSARGCMQQLTPIQSGELRRTINGVLIYTGKPLTHKYRSLITCEDKASAALEGIWRGSEVRIGCIQRLWQKVIGFQATLERDPLPGSVFMITAKGVEVEVQGIKGRTVSFTMASGEEGFISYRPWMEMRVLSFSLLTNEWGMKAGWRLELEEI